MEKKELIEKYEKGLASSEEIQMIESLIENGHIDPLEFSSIKEMSDDVSAMDLAEPSAELDLGFYAQLGKQKSRKWNFGNGLGSLNFNLSWGALAVYSILLFAVGFLINDRSGSDEALVSEISELKEVMMLSMIEGESTTDRLKAVSMTNEITDVSDQIINALLKTLNSDPNNNVRLAALEALIQYTDNPKVREGLVGSIANQESHIVQISLAEVMVGLQEKSSVKELENLIQREEIPAEVKERVQESINALI